MKYIFRGNVVFEYFPETRQMTCGEEVEAGFGMMAKQNAFNYCSFIPEDYKLLSEFFDKAHQHATGVLHESFLKDVEVN